MIFGGKRPPRAQGYKAFEDLVYELAPCIFRGIDYNDIEHEKYKYRCRIDLFIKSPYGNIVVDAKFKQNITSYDIDKVTRDCEIFCAEHAFIIAIDSCKISSKVVRLAEMHGVCIATIKVKKALKGLWKKKYKLEYDDEYDLCRNIELITTCSLDRRGRPKNLWG